MSEPIPTPRVLEAATSSSGGRGFQGLAPDIQRGMYRRLGGAALVYSFAYLLTHVYYWYVTRHQDHTVTPDAFHHIVALVSIALGGGVAYLSGARRIPPARFMDFAILFELAGALGIMAGAWKWESQGALRMEQVAAALGIDDVLGGLVDPLRQAGLRILYMEGVSWVAVWLLAFPLVVPMSVRRTAVGALLTASIVPGVMLFSMLMNGVPEAVRTEVGPYILEATIPTFIVAGIAIFGSSIVYKLTRDLSRARELGSYRLVEKLGQGGMGEVWRAQHRMLVRPAAIKLIRPEAMGRNGKEAATAMRRFEREAQATSELSSPHSIELYDFGVTDEGAFFYVMELLQGIDLRCLVERFGPVPPERAIFLLRQMLHSLTDAHATGVIHRDIKPGNVFTCRRGPDYDFVKVLDFGLVKHVGEADRGRSQLTMEGITSGTPAFMAPEMAYDGARVDSRADLYAVGCVGYWLLTGHLVFEGDSPMATILRHVKDPPVPPSSRTELSIPADLDDLVLRCLRKEPAERPQTAREFSDRLARCSRTLPAWDEDRAVHWWRTHVPDLVQTPARDGATTPVTAES